MPTALLAPTNAPVRSNVSNSEVGLLGFQLETPLIADFDAKAAKCEPLGPTAANVEPVEVILKVHFGEMFVANFVSALSNF